ncbi:hypothetical protein J4463_00605 [Candidatus Pacearchaeota archaeon]|nr:hypothetical protein [Candidatus Pacearchaeota archaeon]
MAQNRNKLIELFISNISNSIVHEILEKSMIGEIISDKYRRELTASFEIAKRYREKINPSATPFPETDIVYIKSKIINRVMAELNTRISKGYKNIDLDLVEVLTENALINTKIKRRKEGTDF